MSLLPPEILALIFGANLDAKTLLNLLCVSRLFKSVAEPLLYRNVSFAHRSDWRNQHRALDAFAKRIAVEAGQHLALCVHSLAATDPRPVQDILPLLHELRRLQFTSHMDLRILSKSLSPLTRLTHFWSAHISVDISFFKAFLESQLALEHLHFRGNGGIEEEFVLSVDALPVLHTLIGHVQQALSILRGRKNVQHLTLYCFEDVDLPLAAADPAFEKVLTLSCCGLLDFERLISFAGFFPNLKYLELRQTYVTREAVSDILKLLHPFSATKVQCVSIAFPKRMMESHVEVDAADLTLTFRELPTLRVLDVEWYWGDEARFFRYRVDDGPGARPPVLHRDLVMARASVWDLWWECRRLDSERW